MILRTSVLVYSTVFLALIGTSTAEADEKQDVTKASNVTPDVTSDENTKETNEVNEPVDKRSQFSGSILGNGLLNGKRDSGQVRENEFEKRYGFLLGNRFSFGKRAPEVPDDMTDQQFDAEYRKKWLGDVYGGGYNIYKRSKRDTNNKRYIRYFGNVLGRGFSFGKRDGPIPDGNDVMSKGGDQNPEDLVYLVPISDDDEGLVSENEKRYFDSVPGYRFNFGKREESEDDDDDDDDDDHDKRYFNSDVGGRFNFGKKSREEGDVDKRYGFVLGRGYAFGKRGSDKRYFGHVLGNGFTFGKRADSSDSGDAEEMVHGVQDGQDGMAPIDKRYGWLLGRGWRSDKRGNKRFGWVLGKGRSFGKRSGDSGDFDEAYFIDEDGNVENMDKRFAFTQGYKLAGKDPKRYGFVLGKGFSFGKRSGGDFDDLYEGSMNVDKRYGFVLGRGFSFGKRSHVENDGDNQDSMKMNKRYGFLLGRGFAFGKRGPPRRAFGSVLGGGFSFGKRSGDATLESMKF